MEKFSAQSFFDLEEFAHKELFANASFVWDALKQLEGYLAGLDLGKIEGTVHPSAVLVNPELISIGEGTVVEPGAYIKGPCILGKGCVVRQGAYVRGSVVAGDACVIGHATEMKHAILLNRAAAPHFNYVGDSILGNDSNLGAGFVCSNYRLDGWVVKVYFNGEKIDTGLKKCGIILGDGSKLGCNGVSNPGTLLGKRSKSLPCAHFGGYFADHSLIRGKS